MHSFVLQVLGIVGLSVMDCHHTPSEFQYLVWNTSNSAELVWKVQPPWSDDAIVAHFSRSEVLCNAEFFCYTWLHTQICGFCTVRKGPWHSLQNGNDIWNEMEDHGLRVSTRLHLSCGVNLSYQIYGWSTCCARTATRVCDDILRSRRTSFPFECPASGVFNIGDVAQGSNLEMSALFAGQKGSNVRTMFAPNFYHLR